MNEFLNIWTTLSTRHYWESHLTHLFSRVALDTIGEFDWSPYIPYVGFICLDAIFLVNKLLSFYFKRYLVIY